MYYLYNNNNRKCSACHEQTPLTLKLKLMAQWCVNWIYERKLCDVWWPWCSAKHRTSDGPKSSSLLISNYGLSLQTNQHKAASLIYLPPTSKQPLYCHCNFLLWSPELLAIPLGLFFRSDTSRDIPVSSWKPVVVMLGASVCFVLLNQMSAHHSVDAFCLLQFNHAQQRQQPWTWQ